MTKQHQRNLSTLVFVTGAMSLRSVRLGCEVDSPTMLFTIVLSIATFLYVFNILSYHFPHPPPTTGPLHRRF